MYDNQAKSLFWLCKINNCDMTILAYLVLYTTAKECLFSLGCSVNLRIFVSCISTRGWIRTTLITTQQ